MFNRVTSLTILFTICVNAVLCEYYPEHEVANDVGHEHHDVGYSYAKFSGPVSGPDHKIVVKDKHGHESYDYAAKPDYHFEYGVEDPKSHVSQNRKEHRQGDDVYGEYSVAQPDGKIRTVKYSADKHNGFQAEVLIDGKPLHYEALQEQQAHIEAQQAHVEAQLGHQEHQVVHKPQEVHHYVPEHHSVGEDEGSSYAGASHGYGEDAGESAHSDEEGYGSYYH
uniref:CSON008442 protein n=1 Tax=Culicoides sonorensis TaxID=179676 RepID=A0A336LJQ8_CULSO